MAARWLIHGSFMLGLALTAACGGSTSGDGAGAGPAPATEPDVVELASVDSSSVTSVATDGGSVYWTDIIRPGVFGVDEPGGEVHRIADDEAPDALSVHGQRLFWLSYLDLSADLLRLSSAATDGAAREDLATGPSSELGSYLNSWHVPVDGTRLYWHYFDTTTSTTRVHGMTLDGGAREVLFETAGPIWQTWVDESALYYSDNTGIHAFDFDTQERRELVDQAFQVRDPAVIDGALYFVGHPLDEDARDGLFRIRDGEALLLKAGDFTITQSRLVADGPLVYFMDNRQASGARLSVFDTRDESERELRTLDERCGSNLVLDGDSLVFATDTRLVRVSKTPAEG